VEYFNTGAATLELAPVVCFRKLLFNNNKLSLRSMGADNLAHHLLYMSLKQ
jgi:hypothetical protein